MAARTDYFFGAPFARLSRWLEDDTLLFWAYVLFLSSCVVSSLQVVTQYLFIGCVIPLTFIKYTNTYASYAPPFLVSPGRKAGRPISILLCAAGLYLFVLI